MAHFYGQVEGYRETRATRVGSKASGIKSSVQSYDGSVIVKMIDDNGVTKVTIEIDGSNSSFYGQSYFHGTIDELKKALLKGR